MEIGSKVVFVLGTHITELTNTHKVKVGCGDIGTITSICKYQEPCHPRFKGQQFAVVSFKKDDGWQTVEATFGIDLRDLRKVQI